MRSLVALTLVWALCCSDGDGERKAPTDASTEPALSPPPPDIPRDKKIIDFTQADRDAWCEWIDRVREARQVDCPSGPAAYEPYLPVPCNTVFEGSCRNTFGMIIDCIEDTAGVCIATYVPDPNNPQSPACLVDGVECPVPRVTRCNDINPCSAPF